MVASVYDQRGQPILTVDRLSKSFGGVVANAQISLAVPQGAIVGLVGPNGSGKTTLFNCISGHHAIDEGRIEFKRRSIIGMSEGQIARLGLVRTFQNPRVFRNMTCMENLGISAPSRGRLSGFRMLSAADQAEACDLLEFAGLVEKRESLAGSLSFGQQKLLEFVMALMSGATLILLDEPTAGMTPAAVAAVVEKLKDVKRRAGVTLIVIEHNFDVIVRLTDYVYCLVNGSVLAEGEPQKIRQNQKVIRAYLGGA